MHQRTHRRGRVYSEERHATFTPIDRLDAFRPAAHRGLWRIGILSAQSDASGEEAMMMQPGAENMNVTIVSPADGTTVTGNTLGVQVHKRIHEHM